MKSQFFLQIFFCVALLVSFPATAEIYKYKDEHGKIHYSDRPFAYKQGDMRTEKKQKSIQNLGLKAQRKLLVGHWQMLGSSAGPRAAIVADNSDIWTFNRDGTYLSRRQGHEQGDAHYYYNNHYLETSESGSRDGYKVLELDKERLVLQSDGGDQVLHFSRTTTPASRHPESTFYRRDQVAKLVAMIACGHVKTGLTDAAEIDKQQRLVFLKTGIVEFEETKFVDSAQFYRKDATFKEIYEPKIDKDVRRCVD